MWVDKTANRYFILILTLISLLSYNNIVAQQGDKNFLFPIETSFLFLNLQHSSQTNINAGFSLVYNYPGFFSELGQISFNYKNTDRDSYFLGLGMTYILFGLNKSIIKTGKEVIYFNGCFGTIGVDGLLGSIGLSYFSQINRSISCELSLDIYSHDGYSNSVVYVPLSVVYYTRGIMANFILQKNLSNKINFSFNIGFSFSQYRYVEYGNYYKYISRKEANEKDYIGYAKWDAHWMIPFGVTLTIHL